MWLEIVVFNKQAEAQRYVSATDGARIYDCNQGAEVIGRTGLRFKGFTDQHVWVVIVERDRQ